MARLTAEDLAANQSRIEKAALRRFTRHGFNGVTMRDVAGDARVPLGSLYNYFADKEVLFKHLIESQSKDFLNPDSPLVRYLTDCRFPDGLENMAEAIAASVDHSADYFKLMYVDVVEFDGRHIRSVFSNLESKFRDALTEKFKSAGMLGRDRSIDPSFAFVTLYLTFYQYFILTKLFGASNVFERKNDQRVIKDLVRLFRSGIGGSA